MRNVEKLRFRMGGEKSHQKCEIAEGVRNEKIFIDLLRSLIYYIQKLININKTCSKHMINKQILNIKYNSIMYIKVMIVLCYSMF